MIIYDPEEYKEVTSIEFSIQHARWHDKVKMLVLFYYKTPRVQKGEALFKQATLKSQDAFRVEASGSSLSAPLAVPMTWKVDDFQSMPLRASN